MLRLLLGIALVGSVLSAQEQDIQIETIKVAEGIYMLVGAGGNIGLSTGPDGTFMIDDQYASMSEKIKAAVAKLTEQTPKFLVNTHYHGDHTGGNEYFGKAEAIIVAHENVRKRLSTDRFMKDFGSQVPAAPGIALPVVTFTQDLSFHMNGEEIHVYHVKASHTDGDSMIHFKKSDVLHMGDCFFNGLYPYFDIHANGSIMGVIAVVAETLKNITEQTKLIPGHGPVGHKKELQAFHDMLSGVTTNVAALIKEGKTLEQVVAAKPSASFDAVWGQGFLPPERFVTLVYNDLIRSK